MKSRGRKKEGARAGEIGRLYFPQGRAPPCSSSIERGEGNRGDWGKRRWLRKHLPSSRSRPFCSANSRHLLLLHGLPISAPSAGASDIQPHILARGSTPPRTYAPSRTACFRFYMGSPSSACFLASRPGPAPSVLHVGSSFLCFSYYVLPLFKSLDYIASLLMLWILDLDMDVLQSPMMCYAACD